MASNTLAADPTFVAPTYNYEATNRFDGALHPSGLVGLT